MRQYNSLSSDIGVILSTVHSSKDMEYDTVYLPDTIDGTFANANREDYQEERRLFYVAMTRALKTGCFFWKYKVLTKNLLMKSLLLMKKIKHILMNHLFYLTS